MYPEAISDPIWELLKRLNIVPDMSFSYLGGGTALALQLGHRKSDDLDFFVTEQFDDLAFRRNVQLDGLDTLIVNQTPSHTELMIQSIKLDFIKERIPLKFPLKALHRQTENIMIADPRDIGRMKIMAIGSRGSKKDFIDLYCLTRKIITLESLIMVAMEEDRGVKYSKLLFLKGLVDFEEAERESDLTMIWDISWEEVKNSLIDEVKKIARKIQEE
jgi:hypothetical protein